MTRNELVKLAYDHGVQMALKDLGLYKAAIGGYERPMSVRSNPGEAYMTHTPNRGDAPFHYAPTSPEDMIPMKLKPRNSQPVPKPNSELSMSKGAGDVTYGGDENWDQNLPKNYDGYDRLVKTGPSRYFRNAHPFGIGAIHERLSQVFPQYAKQLYIPASNRRQQFQDSEGKIWPNYANPPIRSPQTYHDNIVHGPTYAPFEASSLHDALQRIADSVSLFERTRSNARDDTFHSLPSGEFQKFAPPRGGIANEPPLSRQHIRSHAR